MIREGSQTRNLAALLPLVTAATADRFMFCTDDKDVRELLSEGQIDHMIRKSIRLGLDPTLAVRLATQSTARYFGMRRLGAVLPGYQADIAILENLKDCRVTEVFHNGSLVAENSRCTVAAAAQESRGAMRSSVNTHRIEPTDFAIPLNPGANASHPPTIHVIHVLENRIDTERSIEPATIRDGQLVADSSRDLAKMVVIERHRASNEIGRAFARGFNLKSGAIASTVAHDAHNLIVVGMSDTDMATAAIHLVKLHGGLVVVNDGEVLAEVALPIAGLVSDQPAEQVSEKLIRLADAAKRLGCTLDQPFMALSFLSLSVIGKLKLTNQGLIDVEKFERIPLMAS